MTADPSKPTDPSESSAPPAPAPAEPEDVTGTAVALGLGAAAVLLGLAKRSGWAARIGRALAAAQASDPSSHLAAGQAALQRSRYHEATTHFEAAVDAVDPRSAGADAFAAAALVGLGLARYHLGELDESRDAFVAAHRVQPAWPYPLANLARLAAARGRFDEMRDRLEQAVPLIHPQDHYLVAKLTTEEVFADHLDEVLELLVAHDLLSPRDYARHLRAWQQGTLELGSQDINVNVSGTVGALTLGANSPVDGTTVDLDPSQ
jgi:tetratricopeptide (TPR) repeat protein